VLVAPTNGAAKGGLRCRATSESWRAFAAGLEPQPAGEGFCNDIVGAIAEADVEEWTRLAQGLEAVSALVTIPDLKPFQLWAPRIARFSFLLSPYADADAVDESGAGAALDRT
jgi:hypothetical protein